MKLEQVALDGHASRGHLLSTLRVASPPEPMEAPMTPSTTSTTSTPVDVKVAARILGLARHTIANYAKRGIIPAVKQAPGRLSPWLFDPEALEQWRRDHTREGKQRYRVGREARRTPINSRPRGTTNDIVRVTAEIPSTLHQKITRLVARYNEPPFTLTLSSLVTSALDRELERLSDR